MTKILIIALFIVIAGFAGFSLRTPSTETPIQYTTTNTVELSGTEKTETTQTPPVPVTTGVTRDLRNQGLTEVSRSEFDRSDTEVLNLSGNKLTSLQAEVRLLTKLRSLDLSNNNLTNIPAELGQLQNLEVLNLKNNKLTGLPYELGNLKSLKTLDLRGNAYAEADLAVIKKTLPAGANVLTD